MRLRTLFSTARQWGEISDKAMEKSLKLNGVEDGKSSPMAEWWILC